MPPRSLNHKSIAWSYRIILLVWGLLNATLFSPQAPGVDPPDEFNAFQSEEDHFEVKVVSEDTLIVSADYQIVRHNISPLSLSIPPDATPTWRMLDGSAYNTKNLRTRLRLGEDRPQLPMDTIQQERIWLGDHPMLNTRFVGIERFKPDGYTGSKTDDFTLTSATFEVHFNRPIFSVEPNGTNSVHTPSTLDHVVESLVKNPSDTSGFRGLPKELLSLDGTLENSDFLGSKEEPTVKIVTRGEGVCVIDYGSLNQIGWINQATPIEDLILTRNGRIVPFAVEPTGADTFSSGGILWFLDPPSESEQTREKTFLLRRRHGNEDRHNGTVIQYEGPYRPEGRIRSWDYRKTRFEENNPLHWRLDGEIGDINMFWEPFANDPVKVYFDLDSLIHSGEPESASSSLTVSLDGFAGKDFPGSILVNHQAVSQAVQSATDKEIFYVSFPTNYLRPRGNCLVLRPNQSEEGAASPSTYLDWIEVDYPSIPYVGQAELDLSERIPFDPPNGFRGACNLVSEGFQIDGIGGLRLARLDEEGSAVRFQDFPALSPDVQPAIPVRSASSNAVLIDLNQAAHPVRLRKLTGPTLDWEHLAPTDMIVLAPEKYHGGVKEYLEYLKSSEGIASVLVSPEEIYDQFSYGEKDFHAIKDCLRQILIAAPEPKPNYLWLVGESRWDPKNKFGSSVSDETPSPPFLSKIGMASNDQWYTYLVGDDSFPDLIVSRLSVSSPEELENYLEKAKLWRSPKPLGWGRVTSLELADRGFMSSVREIYESGLHRFYYPDALDLIDYPLDVIRKFEAIGREGMEGRGARNDVVRKWSQGVSMVEYLGHGGIIVLSKQAMFLGLNRPDNDVDRLEETDNIPFVFIRSCLSGAVNWPTFPGEVSVSEALIRARKKGATSVISAVGTEQQADQERFARHFYDGVLNHALNNIGAGKVYGHCRSILQNERYIDVCNQYISHGEPTLAFSRPETIDDLSVSFSMGRPEGVLHLAYQPSFEGSAQIRVHNLTNLLYQSDPIHVDPKGFDGTFPLNLPYDEPGPYYVCVYQWDEANHRDAYGSTMFDTAAKAKPEIVHRLKPIPGNGVSPASRVEINFRSDLIRENYPIRGTLRIEGSDDLSQPRPFEAWLNGVTIGSGTLSASSLSVFPFETTFGHAGPETLKAVISASPTAEATWTQVFQEVIQIDESPTLKVAPLEIEPDRPVVGETVELRTVVECIGSVTATLSAAEMFLNGESLKEEETPSLWRNDRYAFPIELSPGESLPLAWRIDRFHPSGKYESRAVVRTPDRSFAATRDLQILNPPEIKTLSIEPLNQPAPIGEDGSAIFRVTVRNVGEATSDPMIVEGADTIQGATFEGSVPALEPGQEATVEVQVDNSSSKYLWIATYRQEPTAVSLRTRSGPEKFPVEIERSISLASNGEPDRPIHWVAEKKSDLSAFTIRYFDATQAGYWPTEENRFFDFPPGELEFPDTSEIFAATQAGLAALEYPDFWWITPNRLQFSPTRQANPIHFILPWKEAKVLAKISPKFATHNQGYLGHPSPFLTLISSEATFDLNFSNTTFDGLFPPKVMEVSPPGLEWELRNKPGGWPSFAGFLFMALPEIRSPVIELDSEGPWSVSFDLEWSNKKEMEPTYQVKHRTGGGSWSAWELVGSQPLHGNQFMFRCWFDPGGRKSDYSIRSATIEFSKD